MENLNLRGAFLHVMGDILGSVGAIIAGILMVVWRWYLADPIVSVLVSVLILYSSWHLLRDSVEVLLEGTPRHLNIATILADMGSIEGVLSVHDLHVWSITSGWPAMSCHVVLRPDVDADVVLRSLSLMMRDRHGIEHTTIQIERDFGGSAAAPGKGTLLTAGFVSDGDACSALTTHPSVDPGGRRRPEDGGPAEWTGAAISIFLFSNRATPINPPSMPGSENATIMSNPVRTSSTASSLPPVGIGRERLPQCRRQIRHAVEALARLLEIADTAATHHDLKRNAEQNIDHPADGAGEKAQDHAAAQRYRCGRTLHIQVGSQDPAADHPGAARAIDQVQSGNRGENAHKHARDQCRFQHSVVVHSRPPCACTPVPARSMEPARTKLRQGRHQQG